MIVKTTFFLIIEEETTTGKSRIVWNLGDAKLMSAAGEHFWERIEAGGSPTATIERTQRFEMTEVDAKQETKK